ncbi:hypothetical protein [Algoriphagus sp. Y33]|nr:hypothetical protein [Algoriphagus sp. Y33]
MPTVEIHLMENAGEAGEEGLPPFAPALMESIFDLTAERIRELPFDLNKF